MFNHVLLCTVALGPLCEHPIIGLAVGMPSTPLLGACGRLTDVSASRLHSVLSSRIFGSRLFKGLFRLRACLALGGPGLRVRAQVGPSRIADVA